MVAIKVEPEAYSAAREGDGLRVATGPYVRRFGDQSVPWRRGNVGQCPSDVFGSVARSAAGNDGLQVPGDSRQSRLLIL